VTFYVSLSDFFDNNFRVIDFIFLLLVLIKKFTGHNNKRLLNIVSFIQILKIKVNKDYGLGVKSTPKN